MLSAARLGCKQGTWLQMEWIVSGIVFVQRSLSLYSGCCNKERGGLGGEGKKIRSGLESDYLQTRRRPSKRERNLWVNRDFMNWIHLFPLTKCHVKGPGGKGIFELCGRKPGPSWCLINDQLGPRLTYTFGQPWVYCQVLSSDQDRVTVNLICPWSLSEQEIYRQQKVGPKGWMEFDGTEYTSKVPRYH